MVVRQYFHHFDTLTVFAWHDSVVVALAVHSAQLLAVDGDLNSRRLEMCRVQGSDFELWACYEVGPLPETFVSACDSLEREAGAY